MQPRISQITALVAAALFATSVASQQIVYPGKGQSPQQQKKDEAECYQWAVSNTGIDPAKAAPPPPPPSQPTTATGTTPGAGARGAARGAVVGGIVGDAGAGAAAGAVAGRSQSRRSNAAQQQQATTQQQQAQSSQNATFAKARGACLEGRGYTVK